MKLLVLFWEGKKLKMSPLRWFEVTLQCQPQTPLMVVLLAICTVLCADVHVGHATLFSPPGFKALHGAKQTPETTWKFPRQVFVVCAYICVSLCALAYTNLGGLWVKANISKVQPPGIKYHFPAKEGLWLMLRSCNNRWQNIRPSLEG